MPVDASRDSNGRINGHLSPHSTTFLTALLKYSPDHIYFKDADGRFLLVSRSLAAAFGLGDPAEAEGKTDFDFFDTPHAERAAIDERTIIRTGQAVVDKEEREIWLDGLVTWVSTTKAPLHDEQGRIIGTFGISRSITEKRLTLEAIEHSERRYRELVGAMHSYAYSVHIGNGNYTTTEHGAGCAAVTGYRPCEYAADPELWIRMVHPDDRDAVRRHSEGDLAGVSAPPLEHRIIRKDGTTRWVRNTVVHRRDPTGRLIGYDGLIEDITDRKVTEQALQRAKDELEQRVRERTAELAARNDELAREIADRQAAEERMKEAVDSLQELSRAKSQFVSTVSHELKTPLTSMSYAIENLMKGIVAPLPPKVHDYIEMIGEDCHRLSGTINDILDLSRIEANKFVLQRIKLNFPRIVRHAIDSIRLLAELRHHDLSFTVHEGPWFADCDPQKMERVIRNVLHNAIAYTPPHGHIRVALGGDPEAPGRILLTVTDSGVGIPRDSIGHISERFFRVSKNAHGTGLGLAISKEIIAHHGGNLALESPAPGASCGTCVSIGIPLAAPTHVLIVDDEPLVLDVLRQGLEATGYRVFAAASVPEAFDILAREHIEAVLADIIMPTADGIALVARIKSTPQWRTIPIVAMTGAELVGAQREILEGFGIPILAKPCTPSAAIERIEECIIGDGYVERGCQTERKHGQEGRNEEAHSGG
jgi:PAS domain S-box-containing protein